MRKKIFERAFALLATVTAADIVLPWVCNENRPALRLWVEDVEHFVKL